MNVLTPWFPAANKPVREGWYIVIACDSWMQDGERYLARWNGRSWMTDDGSFVSRVTHWRGLAFDPGALPDARTPREIQSWAHGWWAALEAKRSGA